MYTSLADMKTLNTVMAPLTNHAKHADVAGWSVRPVSVAAKPFFVSASSSAVAKPFPRWGGGRWTHRGPVAMRGLGDFDFGSLTSSLLQAGTSIGTSFIQGHYGHGTATQALPSPSMTPASAPQIVYMQPGGSQQAPAAPAAPASRTGTYIAIGAGVVALAAAVMLMKKRK